MYASRGPRRVKLTPDEAERRRSAAVMKARYGMLHEDYDRMLSEQGGGCAACGALPPTNRRMHIDHDHTCCPTPAKSCGGCVRGVLCQRCNLALGYIENGELMKQLSKYLEGFADGMAVTRVSGSEQ